MEMGKHFGTSPSARWRRRPLLSHWDPAGGKLEGKGLRRPKSLNLPWKKRLPIWPWNWSRLQWNLRHRSTRRELWGAVMRQFLSKRGDHFGGFNQVQDFLFSFNLKLALKMSLSKIQCPLSYSCSFESQSYAWWSVFDGAKWSWLPSMFLGHRIFHRLFSLLWRITPQAF